MGWEGRELGHGRNFRQWAKNAWLYSDPLQALEGNHLSLTPSIAFRHLPPNSTRMGLYAAVFISAQLSIGAVFARPPKCLGTNKTVKAP